MPSPHLTHLDGPLAQPGLNRTEVFGGIFVEPHGDEGVGTEPERREKARLAGGDSLLFLELRVPTGARWEVALEKWGGPVLVPLATAATAAGTLGEVPPLLPRFFK